MNPRAAFGLSILMSLLSSIFVAALFVWPWLRALDVQQALTWLVAPHMFLRFIGLSFLVPGVVSASLPRAWAMPAGYGDLIAGILAIITTAALAHAASWAIAAAWIFNIWGAADLLFAFYKGARVRLEPGALGTGFYIVTAIVPPLLVSHALIFMLLIRAGGRI
ncbi:MAG: hypothetical protein M0Z48_03545 [Nitrospiraceae bacterium]|nr:hypothetical protein [Nitrospiraceae bacterium]